MCGLSINQNEHNGSILILVDSLGYANLFPFFLNSISNEYDCEARFT